MMRVAIGAQVHPTLKSWLDHHAHPGIEGVSISDLSASETSLVWLTAIRSIRVQSVVAEATDGLSNTDLSQHN